MSNSEKRKEKKRKIETCLTVIITHLHSSIVVNVGKGMLICNSKK
jgi:hypothetical protein